MVDYSAGILVECKISAQMAVVQRAVSANNNFSQLGDRANVVFTLTYYFLQLLAFGLCCTYVKKRDHRLRATAALS